MPTYLLELYAAAADAAQLSDALARVSASAEQLTRHGTPVRHLQTILVPTDETCFWLYDAPSADTALQAARRAGIGTARIVEAQLIAAEPEPHPSRPNDHARS